VRKLLFLALFISVTHMAMCQDEAMEKTGLLMDRCSFEPSAEILILKDEAEISVNNDYSLRLERHVTYKFFKEQKIDKHFAESVFYPSPQFDRYYRFTLRTVELDPTNKTLIARDHAAKVTSTQMEQSGIRMKASSLLEVSYSINFPYNEKIPDWHFQSMYPTIFSSIRIQMPDVVKFTDTIEGGFSPEEERASENTKPIRLNNQNQNLDITEHYYQFYELPSAMQEPFADNSRSQLEHLHMRIVSVTKGTEIKKNFVEGQIQQIVDALSTRVDFLLRLGPSLEIESQFDRRVKFVSDPKERLARIYDLVRRHLTWDRVDSLLAGRTLTKVWSGKTGNSTEINLVLIKLLQTYGYDASPLLVSTRSNGPIDTNEVALDDFNRTVACVKFENKNIVLDATGQFYDFPRIPAAILNTHGLLISADKDHWVEVKDTGSWYKNNVTLLGHLSGDTNFLTNVYVNSHAYAKPEHVDIMEKDSLKGLRRYFERDNKKIQLKHFIAANEWVDTLPLAQEFDIRVPLDRKDNLAGFVATWFSIPDTLFTIMGDRRCDVNFGYRQEYNLVSDFTYPDNYEIFLLPNNIRLTTLNGLVYFEREYHPGATDFSLKQTLVIGKSYFTKTEAIQLAKFLRKVANLDNQEVVLKKNFSK